MDELLAALTQSHDRLKSVLSDETASKQSYDDDWNIGAVASHLGSGAQIFALFLDAGLRGAAAPGPDDFQPIWAGWDSKSPTEQMHDAIAADGAFISKLAGLSEKERATWSLEMFGSTQDLAGVVRMRLAEHALHTWDIEVAGDPSATVIADAVPIVLTNLPALVRRVAKPVQSPIEIDVILTEPPSTIRISMDTEGATMTLDSQSPAAPATLSMPAEAFIRLVYGRLDPDHTPAGVISHGVELDLLRTVFPGV